jgi:lipopolysaccharide transport system ATP-binding protein
VLLFGVVRVDGTAVYGSHSNETASSRARIERRAFAFAVSFDALALLPGKYLLRVHALDPRACGSSTPSSASSW